MAPLLAAGGAAHNKSGVSLGTWTGSRFSLLFLLFLVPFWKEKTGPCVESLLLVFYLFSARFIDNIYPDLPVGHLVTTSLTDSKYNVMVGVYKPAINIFVTYLLNTQY
jgi:hypothetical protein